MNNWITCSISSGRFSRDDTAVTGVNFWASSFHGSHHLPQFAWDGKVSNGNTDFFHSANEKNPWLRIQLSRPVHIKSITIWGRISCCWDRLKNLEIRAGMRNDLTNQLLATFPGPGERGAKYEFNFHKPTSLAEYITLQIVQDQRTSLEINEIEITSELELYSASI